MSLQDNAQPADSAPQTAKADLIPATEEVQKTLDALKGDGEADPGNAGQIKDAG